MATRRRSATPTTTSAFGTGAREGHDATPFYDRFRPPELSDDDTVAPPRPVAEPFVCGDARSMTAVADNSVALVVTSPPYFAGKQYELELQREGIPATYLDYLAMLTDVFAECVRTLEPGGRLAVNVANLGRKPYRSLSADVIRIPNASHLVLEDAPEQATAAIGEFLRAASPTAATAGGTPRSAACAAASVVAALSRISSVVVRAIAPPAVIVLPISRMPFETVSVPPTWWLLV